MTLWPQAHSLVLVTGHLHVLHITIHSWQVVQEPGLLSPMMIGPFLEPTSSDPTTTLSVSQPPSSQELDPLAAHPA